MVVEDVRRAYAERADEYAAVLGSVEAMAAEDRALITRWGRGIDGPVVDAGCGPGHWTQHLHDLGVDVRGVELVPEFVARASERFPDVRFDVGSLEALPVDDDSLAGVLAWYSVIHTEPDDVPGVLEELARCLRPGGTLLLGFFDGTATERLDHRVVTAYSWPVAEMTRLLEDAGFEILGSHTRTDPGSRPHAALLARRAPRPAPGDAGGPRDEEDQA